jgi:sugar O-acyltransferase (sialic acid O-acetyltransferase NeuD family)
MQENIFVVTIPQLGVNDVTAILIDWCVSNESHITTGDQLCELETSKATYYVEAEATGYILHLIDAGEEVRMSQPIALIGSALEALKTERERYVEQVRVGSSATQTLDGAIKATERARDLAQRLGVDLTKVPAEGIIREQDVLRFQERTSPTYLEPIDLSWDPTRQAVMIYGAARGAVTLKECLDFDESYQVVCFVDDDPQHPRQLLGLPVYHGSRLQEILARGVQSMACEIADGRVRLRILKQCLDLGIDLINVIHPKAYVASSARMGKGNYIKSGAIIETNTIIGNCCIIDNGAVIAHDNVIGDGCHIAPRVTMGSGIHVRELTIVGIGSSIATGVRIGQSAIISVGSSVVKDVPDYTVIEGVPGKIAGTRRSNLSTNYNLRTFVDKSTHGSREDQRGWITPPSPDEPGFVEPEFLTRIENDPAFTQLDSDLKIYLYRSYGAQIAENVKIGSGSIILSRVIRLSDNAEIGSDCHIKTDRFVLGKMSVIGDRARIVTREVVIGDVFFSGENILIGGGGAFGPRSALHIGDNCLVSSNCILNTGEPIILEDDVGLSPNVQLYTHNHWQNVLRGYSARHAPIVVESGAYITGNCLVAPGVRIGEGSTILANSVADANVDPYTVVSGVPTRVVSHINTNLTRSQKDHTVRLLMPEMADVLRFQGFDPKRVVYVPAYDCSTATEGEIILTFEVINLPDSLERPVIFDLTSFRVYGSQTRLSDEVRNFLRRRGIRFKPIYWRYTYDMGVCLR